MLSHLLLFGFGLVEVTCALEESVRKSLNLLRV